MTEKKEAYGVENNLHAFTKAQFRTSQEIEHRMSHLIDIFFPLGKLTLLKLFFQLNQIEYSNNGLDKLNLP